MLLIYYVLYFLFHFLSLMFIHCFFQARKSDEDVQKICDMCDSLKVSQLIKILNLYTPADEFEERVAPSFVRKIQNKLQSRAALENEQQVGFCRI